MSLLNHLWDDTVAGPRPSGLNKLHRGVASSNDTPAITRSITIIRPDSIRSDSGSEPPSPASVLNSPRTPTTPGEDWKKLRRRNTVLGTETVEPRHPTVYDWVMVGALDR